MCASCVYRVCIVCIYVCVCVRGGEQVVQAISDDKKRRRLREGADMPNIRRGVMRCVYIVCDMSVSAAIYI